MCKQLQILLQCDWIWSPALALNNHKVGFPPCETHFVTLIGQQ